MPSPALSLQTTDSQPSTDVELAARASAGDELAFECIMRRHNRLLFRTARSILKSDDETEDALQEAYLRAWRALGSFRADAKLSTWLVRIVINESLGRLRRRGAQVIPLDAVVDSAEHSTEPRIEDDPDQRPDRLAMRAEVRRLIKARIDLLPGLHALPGLPCACVRPRGAASLRSLRTAGRQRPQFRLLVCDEELAHR